jgi:hypothetical protein
MGALQSLVNHGDTAATAMAQVILSVICILVVTYIGNRIVNPRQRLVRATLTEKQAVEIYRRKITFMQSISVPHGSARSKTIKKECAAISSRYRVTSKAVLDVWNRKTWVSATSHLWHNEEI